MLPVYPLTVSGISHFTNLDREGGDEHILGLLDV